MGRRGKHHIVRRAAENRLERLPELAAELVNSMSMSSWQVELSHHSWPSAPLLPSLLSCQRRAIRWGVGSSPVWRDPAAMSPGYVYGARHWRETA